MYSIHEVTRLTGIASCLLRIWEIRYGWPNPKRGPNGYRFYTIRMINDLKRVKALIDTGTPIGAIIQDGGVCFPTKLVKYTPRVLFDFSKVPTPRTTPGRALRSRLEDAIIDGNDGAIAECLALLPTIHPEDREPAVHAVLAAAGRMAPR